MAKFLNLNWQTQEVTPTLIEGADALRIYNSLPEQARVGLKYDESSQTMIGSTPFAVANLDVLAKKYGARTPNLRDLSRPELMKIAQGKYYIDSRGLVARSRTDPIWPKNDSFLKTIYELAEEKLGKIKGPFMIEGFTFVPNSTDRGYGLNLVATSDLKIIQDERFGEEYNGKPFSEVDELGLPKFDRKGSRTFYARDKGLSRLCLDRDMSLDSNYEDLAYSDDYGRVVVVK